MDGALSKLTTPPLKTIVYTYNGAARAISAVDSTDGINFATSATYAPQGALTGMTNGNTSTFAGITTNNAYNDRLQPILLSAASPSGTVFSFCFDFHLGVAVNATPCSFSASSGNNGNVYQMVNNRDNTRTENFTYDPLNRIASGYSSGTQWGETFTIDSWGNLTNRAGVTGKTSYEPLNTSAGTNNQLSGYGYDVAGSMTSNGSTLYVYDAENRLVWTSGYKYVYDGNGDRVEKCVVATSTTACPTSGTNGTLYWRNVDGGTLDESDLSGNASEEYIFLDSQRIARRDVSTNFMHYYFSDHLGSHGVVENATGSTCEQDIDYYPYGGVEQDYCGTVGQNYKFTDKERDTESGLDNFEARYLGSSLGRFMSPDPLGGHQEDPQTLNKYAYVRNNPTSLTDPTGLDFNLGCDKNNDTTCQGGHQYYQDENGDYKETVVKSDDQGNLTDQSGNKYSGTVDGDGVHFSSDGGKTSSTGSWVDKSKETKFTQKTGALAGFRFDFSQPGKGQSFSGTFSAGTNFYGVKAALKNAGFSVSYLDELTNIYEMYHDWSLVNFRSPGDPDTGQKSVHFLVNPGDKIGLVVPTTGKFHGYETDPNKDPFGHLRRDVPW